MARDALPPFRGEGSAASGAGSGRKRTRFPSETVEKMARSGFLGIPCAKEWGGQGCDADLRLCVEELSRVCATTGVVVSAHTSLACDPIEKVRHGGAKTEVRRSSWRGGSWARSRSPSPGAGTDASGQQTRAVLEGENYRLNGSKIFITNAGRADVYIVFAIADKSLGTKGISAFIVEKGFPGFSVGKRN